MEVINQVKDNPHKNKAPCDQLKDTCHGCGRAGHYICGVVLRHCITCMSCHSGHVVGMHAKFLVWNTQSWTFLFFSVLACIVLIDGDCFLCIPL